MMGNLSFKKLSAIAVVFGFVGISGGVMAGQKVVQNVTAHGTFIIGNLADARNSADSMQMIETHDYGTHMYIIGTMSGGSTGSCVTSNATAMAQLRAANSDAQLRANISNGTCNNVFVTNSSKNATKNH